MPSDDSYYNNTLFLISSCLILGQTLYLVLRLRSRQGSVDFRKEKRCKILIFQECNLWGRDGLFWYILVWYKTHCGPYPWLGPLGAMIIQKRYWSWQNMMFNFVHFAPQAKHPSRVENCNEMNCVLPCRWYKAWLGEELSACTSHWAQWEWRVLSASYYQTHSLGEIHWDETKIVFS